MLLRDVVYQLVRIVKAHVKAGGEAHLPANERRAGFMSSDAFRDSLGLGKTLPKEITPENPQDVFKLKNGFWVAEPNYLINLPSNITGIVYIDVSRSEFANQRRIEVTESLSGKKWVKEFHTNYTTAQIPVGWRRVLTETLIFTNADPQSPEGTVMTMSEPLGVFDELKIVYSYEGVAGKAIYLKNTGNLTIRETNMANDGVLTTLTHAEMLIQRFKMVELTVSMNKSILITGNAKSTYHNSSIKIEEIWGIK